MAFSLDACGDGDLGGGGLGAVITRMGGLKGVYGICVGVLQPAIVLKMTG